MSEINVSAHLAPINHINCVVNFTESGHLKLAYWPQLTLLPEEALRDAARICALLAVRPTSPMLVARLLDIPRNRVDELLLLISAHAPQDTIACSESAPGDEAATPDHEEVMPEEWASHSISLIHKLWNRLRAVA